jgi:hypothetical protein
VAMTSLDALDCGSATPKPRRLAVTVAVMQVYVVVSYLVGALLPYLWQDRTPPPMWLTIGPAWVFGVAGFWLAILGAAVATPLAAAGAGILLAWRNSLSRATVGWLIAGTAATIACAVFVLSPLGQTIGIWVVD